MENREKYALTDLVQKIDLNKFLFVIENVPRKATFD